MPFTLYKNNLVRLLLALLVLGQVACQSDARDATRIPPTPGSLALGEWQESALKALEDRINNKVDLDQNLYKRAKIHLNQEKYDLAEADIDDAIGLKDNVGEYYLLRSQIRREKGKIDEALADAQRAEVLQQNLPELYILLADLHQEKKQFREAENYLVTALDRAPYEGDAYFVKGMLQSKMSDTTAGLENLKYALTMNPRMLRAYQQISAVYSHLGDKQEALRYNEMASARFPDRAELLLERGDIYRSKLNLDSAVMSYRKAIQLDSTLVQAHFQMGSIYVKWKSYAPAISTFENVLKYRPNYPTANFLLGYCLEKLGNDERAIEYYTDEANLDPTNEAAQAAIVRIQYRKQRQYDPAGIFATNKTPAGPRAPAAVPRTLDSMRVQVKTIQPRRSIEIGRDSALKIKIK